MNDALEISQIRTIFYALLYFTSTEGKNIGTYTMFCVKLIGKFFFLAKGDKVSHFKTWY